MKIKSQLLPLLLLLFSNTLFAQPQISVKSFVKRENDITARVEAPKKDQNGDLCAIIKVVTTQTGFIWDPDALGIISADYKTGEYWIYVPYGAKRLTIKHEKLGILRDYMYPLPIEKAGVYIMELTTGKVTTTVEDEQIASQWLVINSDPTGSDIYIDDQPANQTPYQNELPVGKHTYRLSHDLYLPTAGLVELTADKKEVVNLTLQPNFGKLNITTTPETGATVSLDDVNTGKTTPCALEQVKAGEHTVTIRLNMYQSISQIITMQPGGEINLPVTLSTTFASVTVNTEPSSDIYIAGEKRGTGTWTGPLLPGVHRFEARKEGFAPAAAKREVINGKPLIVNLHPVAKTGTLKVMTTPVDAAIILNGENKGTTPATLRNLLVGNYTLALSLAGYGTTYKNITIVESETNRVNETLGHSGFAQQSSSETINHSTLEMVAVKGGTFQMGNNEGTKDQKPVHTVTLSDFSIGKTEVTQAQWKAIMGSDPSSFKGEDLPVENVSWNDVQDFIGKLNSMTGKTYRLPTEAEWEYAAGGGATNRTKWAGTTTENSLTDYAWLYDNSNKTTHPVGTRQPNQLGIYDMSGNVEEWCNDVFDENYYKVSPTNNPQGASSNPLLSRVSRGGCWHINELFCRVDTRYGYVPGFHENVLGFRLVLVP